MRRLLGVLVSSVLMLTVLAVPAAAKTTQVDCRAGADLQAALDAASPGDTLVIRGTCVGNFEVVVDDLTLTGTGPRPTLRAATAGDVLHSMDSSMTLVGLTISGGGLFFVFPLTLERVTVVGGGIFHVVSLAMSYSTVRDGPGVGIWGGSATIEHSTISGHAGVGIASGGSTTVSHSLIKGNAGGGIGNSRGSAFGYDPHLTVAHSRIIDNGGHGISNDGRLTVRYSIIRGNTSTGVGGGIVNSGRGISELTLIHSRVVHNTATDGGGIYNDVPSVVTIWHSVIKHNAPNDCVGC